jgi:hypothetical protein
MVLFLDSSSKLIFVTDEQRRLGVISRPKRKLITPETFRPASNIQRSCYSRPTRVNNNFKTATAFFNDHKILEGNTEKNSRGNIIERTLRTLRVAHIHSHERS